jgi:hypothetical protein
MDETLLRRRRPRVEIQVLPVLDHEDRPPRVLNESGIKTASPAPTRATVRLIQSVSRRYISGPAVDRAANGSQGFSYNGGRSPIVI